VSKTDEQLILPLKTLLRKRAIIIIAFRNIYYSKTSNKQSITQVFSKAVGHVV
jgi:hypothetical protein